MCTCESQVPVEADIMVQDASESKTVRIKAYLPI